jgi:hypothetical protein
MAISHHVFFEFAGFVVPITADRREPAGTTRPCRKANHGLKRRPIRIRHPNHVTIVTVIPERRS